MMTLLRKPTGPKPPDQSILNMSMDSFVFRYLMNDNTFENKFLRYTHGEGNERILIAEMTVRDFIERIRPDEIITERVRIGRKGVVKMQKQFTRFGITWQ
jgi:hypothetical protein